MNRFFFSPAANRDLAELKAYFDMLPKVPAHKIASALQAAFDSIAENPYRGVGQSELTRRAGFEVRSLLVNSYRIFYSVGGRVPEIMGVLHTSRNIASIMAKRVQ